MGDAVLNTLTNVRRDVAEALRAAGIDAQDYVSQIDPPVCVVLPSTSYVSAPVGQNPFRHPYSVGLQVLVVSANAGSDDEAAEGIDSMLVKVVNALDEDWDINEVTAPSEVTLGGITYLGALVTLAKNTSLEEVM